MMPIIKSYKLNDELAEQMDNIADVIDRVEQVPRNKFILHMSGAILRFLGRFLCVNLDENHQQMHTHAGANKQTIHNCCSRLCAHQWWPILIRIIYIASTIRMTINIYYQYVYDLRLLRYQRVKLNNEPSIKAGDDPNLASEKNLLRQVEAARATLKLIGAPFLNAHFIGQIYSIFDVLMGLTSYMQTYIFLLYFKPFDFSFVRAILNFQKELKYTNLLIRKEVNKFIKSSQNFAEISLGDRVIMFAGLSYRTEEKASEWPESLVDYTFTIRQLERMTLSGTLMPCNKSPDWIVKLAYLNCLFSISFPSYCLLAQLTMYILFVTVSEYGIEHDLMDMVAFVEHIAVTVVMIVAGTFYAYVVSASCIDQIYLVINLRKSIEKSVCANKRRFESCLELIESGDGHQLAESSPRQADSDLGLDNVAYDAVQLGLNHWPQIDQLQFGRRKLMPFTKKMQIDLYFTQMNAELLRILMQYKIFVTQLRPSLGGMELPLVFALFMILFVPLVGRIHVPYINQDVKVYIGGLALFCALAANILVLIPISYLHARCLEIYKPLSSLMAHSIEVVQHQGIRRIYDRHSIWMLRKELNHPERFAAQFTTNFFGLRVTYSTMLRINFWSGILTLSIFVETASQHNLLGNLMVDPLAVF